MKKLIVVILTVASLSGCASVQMASIESDRQSKQFSVAQGKSSVYIYRDENFGSAIKIPISVNDKIIGQTAPHVFSTSLSNQGKIKYLVLESQLGISF